MIRKALIIGCDNTASGSLKGPSHDLKKMRDYLASCAGGYWFDSEIKTLLNPTKLQIREAISRMKGADYTLVVFSGHGGIAKETGFQYVEVLDGDLQIHDLFTSAARQLLILDACRSLFSICEVREAVTEMFSEGGRLPSPQKCRLLFEDSVRKADAGLTICYSSSREEASADTPQGGAYLLSLITCARRWFHGVYPPRVLTIKEAHQMACVEISNYLTIQNPCMNFEKRRIHFPFAVKG